MFPVEYLSEVLRRLTHDPRYAPHGWDRDAIRLCRKKIQLLVCATGIEDLYAMRSLQLRAAANADEPATIPINPRFALALTFKTEESRTVILLDLVDYR